MKVYEMMNILSEAPSGAEVAVELCSTMRSEVVNMFLDDETFVISGGDAEVIDSEGDSMGYLSGISDVESEECDDD